MRKMNTGGELARQWGNTDEEPRDPAHEEG